MRKKFRLLLLLSFFYQPTIFADIEDQYRNQQGKAVCSYENAQFYSLNSDHRYCVRGGFWKEFVISGNSYSEGVLNKSLKNIGLFGSNTIEKYKIEGDDLVRYSCKGTLDSYNFECVGPVDRDVIASTSIDGKKFGLGQLFNQNSPIRKTYSKYNLYLNSGLSKVDIGDYSGAIDDFTNAIKLNPNSFEAYANRASAKGLKGDYSGAIDDYTKSINLNPSIAKSFNNRGTAKDKKGDYSGAINDFSTAIKLSPNSFEAYGNRGSAKFKLKDYSGAIDDYSNAIKLNPNVAPLYSNRGSAKFNAFKDYEGACKDFKIAIKLGDRFNEKWFSKNCKN